MNYLIPIIIKVLFCSYVCMLFLYYPFISLFLFILFRSNSNDENHEYLAPVNDENTRGDVENPKEIQDSWDRFEQGRIAIDEPFVVVT